MKALILKELQSYPTLENYSFSKLPEESKVQIQFSALNRRDYWITKGLYPGIKTPVILGSDGAGLNEEGHEVLINPGFFWGGNSRVQSSMFEVLGMPRNGTFAEFVSVPSNYIYKTPMHLSTLEASAIPLAGLTAYRALITKCNCTKVDKVLINGVGGGVAHFALLFALAMQCEVWVTSGSNIKINKAIELGAKGGVNYRDEDIVNRFSEAVPDGFDVIIDSAGGEAFNNLIEIAAPGARIGIYGGTLGKIKNLNTQKLFWKQISILGTTMGSDQDFEQMLKFVEDHKIKPVIDEVFSFKNADKAFNKLKEHSQFGKIVFQNG